MKVSWKTYEIPFRFPFTISMATKSVQPTLLVELEHFGIKGYGEAPAISYYNIPLEKMVSDLERKKAFVEKFSFTDPERYWHYLHHLFPQNPFLVCALDMAGWDIFGKMRGAPLYRLWGLDTDNAPLTDYTIGIDTTEGMIKKIKEKNWPLYKIKVGMEGDVDFIRELRRHTSSPFRLDANGGWTRDNAPDKINELQHLNVQFIEQPLPNDDWEGMRELFQKSPLPLIADESCVAEEDLLRCYEHFHGVNIKLTKCSGITPAKRMIEKCRELNMLVMLGCMNETSVGSAALAHLAPLADFLDMDGPLLLANDIASGQHVENGKIIYNDLPGLGINLFN